MDLWNCLPVDIVDVSFWTAFHRSFNLIDFTDYYAALLRRRGRILRRTLSVRLSVRPFPLLLTLKHRPRVVVNMADVRYRLFCSHARAAYSTAISAAQACWHCIWTVFRFQLSILIVCICRTSCLVLMFVICVCSVPVCACYLLRNTEICIALWYIVRGVFRRGNTLN